MPDRSSSLLVAPWIEMPSIRDWMQQPTVIPLLQKYGVTLDLLLQNFLDAMQPHPCEGVRLGYTVAINVFDLFSHSEGEWRFDPARMQFYIELFRNVARPVVVNLRANHFVGDDPLVTELMSHENSYARLNDGALVKEVYYSNAVFAPTFALDPSIPLNRFRFEGFRQAASLLADFDRRHPSILHSVTLAGELHHFLPELANPQAAGMFEGALMTDYSPASVREFVEWLKARHGSVQQLNERFGTPFASWEEVEPPRWDFRTRPDAPSWSHMDSYATGYLPVFGWMRPPVTGAMGTLTVYVDAKPVGQAEYGLSRLDVYDAVAALRQSDVGFRFDLDYRQLAPGRHILHVVLEQPDGCKFRLGIRGFYVEGEPARSLDGIYFAKLDNLPECVDENGGFGWLDHPTNELRLHFNPYAGEWQTFREHQVEALLHRFAEIAVEAGIAREKLYSHQIMPQFEGSWNRVAFAVTGKPPGGDLFYPGLDLYGGATVYSGMQKFLQGQRYAVPELHPRMGKNFSRDVFLQALQYHRDLGAAFVSPYFMALREPAGQRTTSDPLNLQDALLIHPLNIAVGSLFFYSALLKFLNNGC